ncbi:MAG: hypothetical protein ACRDHU_13830 [Actinomycetota bacterium]
MSGRKRKRRTAPAPPPSTRRTAVADPEERAPRRSGLFGSALFGGGASALPPIGRSLGRGLVAVASQPALVVLSCVLVVGTWLVLVAIGFEGTPSRLVDVLAMPPISTYFDLGTGASLYGIGPAFLAYLGVSIGVRTLVYSVLSGLVLEALEDGRVSRVGVLRGMQALPTVLVVQVASFSLIVAGNLIFPVLGPGIGFLGFVSALVAGLFFLGFAPTAAIREGRPVMETIRRSARAAMLPGGRHLVLSSLYFFLALPVVVGFAPGGDITANPSLGTWIFVLLVNVLHVAFMAAFAYRWVVAEPAVPEEPVRRRTPTRTPPAAARRR